VVSHHNTGFYAAIVIVKWRAGATLGTFILVTTGTFNVQIYTAPFWLVVHSVSHDDGISLRVVESLLEIEAQGSVAVCKSIESVTLDL
jgi:hypothetical protein